MLILVAFSAQRVLIDIIAGFSMFTEKWYSVGDTIAIPMMELQGVVEDLSLRSTRLRSLDGEVINIHNSQIAAVRVLPGGVKEFDVELVAGSREAAELLFEHVATILPEGPRRSSSAQPSTRSTSSRLGSFASACAPRSPRGGSGS